MGEPFLGTATLYHLLAGPVNVPWTILLPEEYGFGGTKNMNPRAGTNEGFKLKGWVPPGRQ